MTFFTTLLASNKLISISEWLGTKIADKGFDFITEKITKNNKINDEFYKIIDEVSSELQQKYPEALGGNIEYFFKDQQIFSEIFKLLFTFSNINYQSIYEIIDRETLPENFLNDFISKVKEKLQNSISFNEILTNKEIYVLIYGIGIDIKQIENNTSISIEELRKIHSKLNQIIDNNFSLNKFKENYKTNALNNLSQVNFLGLGIDISIKRKNKKLQDVYVKQNFSVLNGKSNYNNEDELLYSQLLDTNNRIVVLGDPGSGKSVLVKSLICDIISKNKTAFNTDEVLEYIPFRIELRKYCAFKKEGKGSIIKYLIYLLDNEYGINNITEHILYNIFNSEKIIIFFDGLDEIFRIEDKVDIRNDIENFSNIYINFRIIVTSRKIGYDDAALNEDNFCVLSILNFDFEQIEEYVKKWYLKEEDDDLIRDREVQGFISAKDTIDIELIKNPLLLSLIIILYRNSLKIPESKLEIYQSCTKTLVDKWDASKELDFDIESIIYKNKEKIFADLAYWQYQQLSSEHTSITYEKAKRVVIKTIYDKFQIGEYESEELAENFMEYAKSRSIYFDNNFTHKTFLEYFTAYWIYSNIEKKHKLSERNNLISKFIGNSFWYIVLELLLNLIDKDQADTEIIDNLLENQCKESTNSLHFILTVIPSLKNISKKQIKSIFRHSVSFLNDIYLKNKSEKSLSENLFNPFSKLFFLTNDYQNLILEVLKEFESEDENKKFIYTIYLEIINCSYSNLENKPFDLTDNISFDKICNEDPYLTLLNYYNYGIGNNYFEFTFNFIKKFGAEKSTKDFEPIFEKNVIYISALRWFFIEQFAKKNINDFEKNIIMLQSLKLTKEQMIEAIKQSFISENENDLTNYFKDCENLLILELLGIYAAKNSPNKVTLNPFLNNTVPLYSLKANVISIVNSKSSFKDKLKTIEKLFNLHK